MQEGPPVTEHQFIVAALVMSSSVLIIKIICHVDYNRYMALNMAHKQEGAAVPLFIASCFLTDSSCLAKLSSFIRRCEGNKNKILHVSDY